MYRISKDRVCLHDGTPVDIPVISTGNTYSGFIDLSDMLGCILSYRAKSETGTPDIDLYHEQTHVPPATPASGNSAGTVNDGWAAPTGAAKLADITDENWHHLTISPVTCRYIRFLLDGQGSNPADCTVEMYVSKQTVVE